MADQEMPRRNKLYQFTPAEKAIWNAAQEVEKAGVHPYLTNAVNLLAKAREWVADYVDGEINPKDWDEDAKRIIREAAQLLEQEKGPAERTTQGQYYEMLIVPEAADVLTCPVWLPVPTESLDMENIKRYIELGLLRNVARQS